MVIKITEVCICLDDEMNSIDCHRISTYKVDDATTLFDAFKEFQENFNEENVIIEERDFSDDDMILDSYVSKVECVS